MKNYTCLFLAVLLSSAVKLPLRSDELEVRPDESGNTISVFRKGEKKAILTQVALKGEVYLPMRGNRLKIPLLHRCPSAAGSGRSRGPQ